MLIFLLSGMVTVAAYAAEPPGWLDGFNRIYQQQLGQTKPCDHQVYQVHRLCGPSLRNTGNGPFVMHHDRPTEKVMVLFHGLSDSPFFLGSIAPFIHQQGFTVIVGLLPAHGLKASTSVLHTDDLEELWQAHVDELIHYAHTLGEKVYLGGFSTGGALVTRHVLQNPGTIDGLLLFSAALQLEETVERVSRIWGSRWLLKLIDGDNFSSGPNPYKYDRVSKYAAMELVTVIDEIRDQMAAGTPLQLPIFAAHSLADTTTLWSGVASLLDYNQGPSVAFRIEPELEVCHADLVVNEPHLEAMDFDETQVILDHPCSVPKANPKHAMMMNAMVHFLKTYAP